MKSEQKIGSFLPPPSPSRVTLILSPSLCLADILFSNIKHLIFQPCDGELVVVLHIHLKNPILIGKKKAKDIQFFKEAADASFDETGNKKRRRNYGDDDELEAEQEERKRRTELNKYFRTFGEKISEAVSWALVPYSPPAVYLTTRSLVLAVELSSRSGYAIPRSVLVFVPPLSLSQSGLTCPLFPYV